MLNRRPILGNASALALVLGLLPMPLAAASPDFSGTWRVNPKRSDDAKAKVAAAAGSSNVAGGGTSERLFRRGNEESEIDRIRLRDQMLAVAEESVEMEIQQTASEVKIASGERLRIHYFGREHVRENPAGGKLKARIYWKGEQLVIDQQGDAGLRILELYTLMPSGTELIQVVRFESKLFLTPFETKRIYEKVPAAR